MLCASTIMFIVIDYKYWLLISLFFKEWMVNETGNGLGRISNPDS